MAETNDFSLGGLLDGVSDSFAELAKTYLTVEGVKAQAGALKSQAEYNALTTYNPSYISNPNAYPLTPAQQQALLAQRSGTLGGSLPLLLIGGGVLLVAVLLLK
jgi:hypothetical protein